MWNTGERVMFFLQRENGYLRTTCDQYKSCTITVLSGAHPSFRANSPEAGIIDLLLTRGQGVADSQFVGAIENFHAFYIDPNYVVGRLRRLIAEETGPVAQAACKKLQATLNSNCVPAPWNIGPWAIPCNERGKTKLPCAPGCCQFGEKPPLHNEGQE
jgi:hypothetical protein